MLRNSKSKINVVEKKWVKVLHFTFKLKWINIWCKTQNRKKVNFMWALWNKAITVNQAKVDSLINQTCPLCDTEEKSTLHKFWECCHVGLGIHTRHCM